MLQLHYLFIFIDLEGWSGTKSTIAAAIYWPVRFEVFTAVTMKNGVGS
jgi:hypothetical protein